MLHPSFLIFPLLSQYLSCFILVILFPAHKRGNNVNLYRPLLFDISHFTFKNLNLCLPSACMQMIDVDPNMEVASRFQQPTLAGKIIRLTKIC